MEPDSNTIREPLARSNTLVLATQNSRNITYVGFFGLPIIIAGIVILILDDNDCKKPIRTWLYGMVISYGILFALAVLEITAGIAKRGWRFAGIPLSLICLFQLAWYITGSVWLFGDDTCSDEWYNGYVLSLVLLIFFYAMIGLIVLLMFCFLCCTAVFIRAVTGAMAERAKENENYHFNHEETKE